VSEWKVNYYESGTVSIVREDTQKSPWLYVLGFPEGNELDKLGIARNIAARLNGKWDPLPVQFIDFSIYWKGYRLVATGPVYDMDPPKLSWGEKVEDAPLRRQFIREVWERLRMDKEKA
jgi:hypothetical protein